MNVLLLSTDLMTASQVEGAARQAGVQLKVAGKAEEAVTAAEHSDTELVILDLASPGVDPASLVPQLKNLAKPPRVLAFGPHVHAEKLAAAEAAGCDQVLSRGQFFSQLPSVMQAEE